MFSIVILAAIALVESRSPIGICSGRSGGTFLAPDLEGHARCSNHYIQCLAYRPVQQTCPDNLSFDPTIPGCVPQSANPLCSKNPCRFLEDGDYPHPDGQCHYYMRCYDGWTTIITCVEQDHVWNREEKKCQHKSVVPPPCGTYTTTPPTPPTTRGTTPPPITSSTPGEPSTSPPFCYGRPSGNYLPPGEQCSKYYIQCHQFRLTRAECPNKLSYDPVKAACVKVSDNPLCRNNPCYALNDGVYKHPSGECAWYLRCDNGWAIFVECGQVGTVWNQAAKQCTDPSLVPAPCGTYFTTRTPVITSTLSNPPSTTTNTGVSCVQKSSGDLIADINKACSSIYYVCLGSRFAIRRDCAPGTYFDPDTAYECKTPGMFANPDKPCDTRFIICDVALIARTMSCSVGLYFDEEYGVCLLFSQVPTCSLTPRPITPPTTNQPTTPGIDFDCQGKTGNLPDPAEECSERFIVCTTAGIAYYRFCAAGTYYDQELKVCLFFHEVPECVGTPRTVAPPTTTPIAITTPESEPPTVPPFVCPPKDGNYPPIGVRCPGFYWQCHSSGVRRIECPLGLSFDHTKNACVRISNNPFCSTNPCQGFADGLYKDPKGSCDTYMRCITGWAVFIQCENTRYVWNDEIKKCAPRSQVAPPCGSFFSTIATNPPTNPPTRPPIFTCYGKAPGNYREPIAVCLPFFHQCHRVGLPQRVFCPGELRYDHEDQKCIGAVKCFEKYNLVDI